MKDSTLISEVSVNVPDVKQLGALYQRAIEKNHQTTAQSAQQAVLALGRAEAALAEARTLAAFLDEV